MSAHSWDEGIGEVVWDDPLPSSLDVDGSDELRSLKELIERGQRESAEASRRAVEAIRRTTSEAPSAPSKPPEHTGIVLPCRPDYNPTVMRSDPPDLTRQQRASHMPAAAALRDAGMHSWAPPPPPAYTPRDEALLRSAEAVEREAAEIRARALANLKGRMAAPVSSTTSAPVTAPHPPRPSARASDEIRSRAAVLAAAAAVAAVTAPEAASAVALFGGALPHPSLRAGGAASPDLVNITGLPATRLSTEEAVSTTIKARRNMPRLPPSILKEQAALLERYGDQVLDTDDNPAVGSNVPRVSDLASGLAASGNAKTSQEAVGADEGGVGSDDDAAGWNLGSESILAPGDVPMLDRLGGPSSEGQTSSRGQRPLNQARSKPAARQPGAKPVIRTTPSASSNTHGPDLGLTVRALAKPTMLPTVPHSVPITSHVTGPSRASAGTSGKARTGRAQPELSSAPGASLSRGMSSAHGHVGHQSRLRSPSPMIAPPSLNRAGAVLRGLQVQPPSIPKPSRVAADSDLRGGEVAVEPLASGAPSKTRVVSPQCFVEISTDPPIDSPKSSMGNDASIDEVFLAQSIAVQGHREGSLFSTDTVIEQDAARLASAVAMSRISPLPSDKCQPLQISVEQQLLSSAARVSFEPIPRPLPKARHVHDQNNTVPRDFGRAIRGAAALAARRRAAFIRLLLRAWRSVCAMLRPMHAAARRRVAIMEAAREVRTMLAVMRAWHSTAHAKFAVIPGFRVNLDRRQRIAILRQWRLSTAALQSARADALRVDSEKNLRAIALHNLHMCRRAFAQWHLGVRAQREGALLRASEEARRALVQRVLHKIETGGAGRRCSHASLTGAKGGEDKCAAARGEVCPAASASAADPAQPVGIATRSSDAPIHASPWDAHLPHEPPEPLSDKQGVPPSRPQHQHVDERAARRQQMHAAVLERKAAAAAAAAFAKELETRNAAEAAKASDAAAAEAAAKRQHLRAAEARAYQTAVAHHELRLMRSLIWTPLLRNMRAARDRFTLAVRHDQIRIVRAAFHAWKAVCIHRDDERLHAASRVSDRVRFRIGLKTLRVWTAALANRQRVLWRIGAIQRTVRARTALLSWRRTLTLFVQQREALREMRAAAADAMGRRCILRQAWRAWLRTLPVLKEEAAAEARRQALWEKAVAVLKATGVQ